MEASAAPPVANRGPRVTVVNGPATGPLGGPVVYRFEIATDANFVNMVAILSVARTGGTTARPHCFTDATAARCHRS